MRLALLAVVIGCFAAGCDGAKRNESPPTARQTEEPSKTRWVKEPGPYKVGTKVQVVGTASAYGSDEWWVVAAVRGSEYDVYRSYPPGAASDWTATWALDRQTFPAECVYRNIEIPAVAIVTASHKVTVERSALK